MASTLAALDEPPAPGPGESMVARQPPVTGTQALLATLQAACDALHAAPHQVTSVGVSGRLPAGSTALPLMARAETLGREFRFGVITRLDRTAYDVRFTRAHETHDR